MAQPATYVTFNSITDNPTYGDERNFLHIKPAGTDKSQYTGNIKLVPGTTYDVFAFYHNNASKTLNGANFTGLGVAQGAYVRAEMPSRVNKDKVYNGNFYIGADNANPKFVFETIKFTADSAIALRYVPNTAKLHNFVSDVVGESAQREFALDPEQLFRSGSPIGWNTMDGKLPGCNEYAGYITFQLIADFANLDFTKEVRKVGDKDWSTEIKVKPGETVEYLLSYKNTGTVTQNNVTVKDTLPINVTYVDGSTKLRNNNNPDGKTVVDGITTTGLNIGDYATNAVAYTWFQAKMPEEKDLACGANRLTNTGRVDTVNGALEDTADVIINKECASQPTCEEDGTCPVEIAKTGAGIAIFLVVAIAAVVVYHHYYVQSNKLKKKASHRRK